MKEPTLQDILEKGIQYYARREWEGDSGRLWNSPVLPYNDSPTILQVLDKGIQHYIRIDHEEYVRIKRIEEKTRKPVEPIRNITGIDLPDSSEGRRYE